MPQSPERLIDSPFGPPEEDEAARPLVETILRPIATVQGPTARSMVEIGLAEWLAGGPSAFTTVEVVEGFDAHREQELRSVRQVGLTRAANITARLRLLTGQRQPIAGLTWVRPRILSTLDLAVEPGQARPPSIKVAVQRARMLAGQGADIVALTITDELGDADEIRQLVPVVQELALQGIRIAVSTESPAVMRAAAGAGARVLVDDTPAIDEERIYTLADLDLPIILRRNGAIGAAPRDANAAVMLAVAVHAALEERIEMLEGAGIHRGRLILDPGTGPDQPAEESLAILHSLALFHGLGCVLLADCAGLDAAAGFAAIGLNGADVAFSALAQGVQVISADDPARAWAAVRAFRALADARFDETE